jgi:hypothetical protein
MKTLKFRLMLVLTIITSVATLAQTTRQNNKMNDANHGQYNESGAIKIHPYTVFKQVYSEQELLEQIEAIPPAGASVRLCYLRFLGLKD